MLKALGVGHFPMLPGVCAWQQEAGLDGFFSMIDISKHFQGIQALRDVSVDFRKGEIHVVIGENGAGKSTLMKVAAGLYRPDRGRLLIRGREVAIPSAVAAIGYGISMIHQELMPVPQLTVAQNIFLGRERVNRLGFLDRRALDADARRLIDSIGLDLDPRARMADLSVAQVQLVEIVKAVSFDSEMLIMDEPTSAISGKEIDKLYDLIFELKRKGVAIVFISHKLDEVFKVADRITVLRDGLHIATRPAAEMDKSSLIALMIGRETTAVSRQRGAAVGEPLLEVQGLTRRGLFEDISFRVREREILGIAGLMGAGRTELVETIFGLRRADSGRILLRGREVSIRHPADARSHGIALVPEDRKLQGLNMKASTGRNISICSLGRFSVGGLLKQRAERKAVDGMIAELTVKVPTRDTPVASLSGGNQQKVVIAKWLMTEPDLLILDEPTRGIDVGAKFEIYTLISQMVAQGKSVIMVSSELQEIIDICDRVIVLCEGRLTGELEGAGIEQSAIMRCATGCSNA
jgi:ABC-type sugar transport system ATPase subunit